MKRHSSTAIGALILSMGIGFSASVAAIPIDINGVITDVGGVDEFVAITDDLGEFSSSCTPGSNPTNEECWANGALEDIFPGTGNLTYEGSKTDTVSVYYGGGANEDIGAFALLDAPDYYILKNAQGWALFRNLDDLNFGVIDVSSSVFGGVKINVVKRPDTVSHVTEFGSGGETTPVPEPATLALLGVGIVGFGLSRRNRRNTKN